MTTLPAPRPWTDDEGAYTSSFADGAKAFAIDTHVYPRSMSVGWVAVILVDGDMMYIHVPSQASHDGKNWAWRDHYFKTAEGALEYIRQNWKDGSRQNIADMGFRFCK